jgi:hypothetical protein
VKGSVKNRLLLVTLACLPACGAPVGEPTAETIAAGDSPFDRLVDQTGLGAWEFGTCATDGECQPQGCLDSVCSPIREQGVCDTDSRLGQCLTGVETGLCGCVDNRCRWRRDVATMQCAVQGADRPGTLPVVGSPRDVYPVRIRE